MYNLKNSFIFESLVKGMMKFKYEDQRLIIKKAKGKCKMTNLRVQMVRWCLTTLLHVHNSKHVKY